MNVESDDQNQENVATHDDTIEDLERKLAHIEQFGPILVEKLVNIVGANDARKKKAEEGLKKILGRDSASAVNELEEAQSKLAIHKMKEAKKSGVPEDELELVIEENKASSKSPKQTKKPKK